MFLHNATSEKSYQKMFYVRCYCDFTTLFHKCKVTNFQIKQAKIKFDDVFPNLSAQAIKR